MIEPLLKSQLAPVARREQSWRRWRGLALWWAAATLTGAAFILVQRLTGWATGFTMPALGAVAVGGAVVVWWRSRKWEPDFRQAARQIEQHHPELHALLLTAIEQQPDPLTGKLSYLQERVIREAILEGLRKRWIDSVSDGRVAWMRAAHMVALAVFVVVLSGLRVSENKAVIAKAIKAGVTITPGDTSIERGNGLVVLARFTGPLPADVKLVIGQTMTTSRDIALVKSLDDPVFGGSVPEVTGDLVYHVEYAGQRTRDFKVSVFEFPRLERADARITYPTYTGLAEKRIEDTRRVSAVEGSRLELTLQLNKPVASARLVGKDKSVVPLLTETNRATAALKDFPLDASQTYELQLVDTDGRTNKVPAQFVLEALKNRAPELKLAAPRGDQRVSPLEEINFQAETWDDFGLRSFGLTYTVAGQEPKTLVLGESTKPNEKRQFNHLLKLEELGVVADQLLSWFIWADDTGPDGEARRTSSDMYFAEVRPFEEIFREGQSQESQSSEQQPPQGNEATKLAELQKQIINATWKLQRRDTGRTPSAQYLKDAPVVRDSQEKALEQAEALKERATDPRAETLLEGVTKEMEKALERLAAATNSPAPLPTALAAEQAAYQALLKLAGREYQVSQNRSRSQSQSGQQRQQQQLSQLELKQKEDRYETQRQAQPQQNAEQREQLQVLNRLKELAQRQQDLNERLKELQTALQEAKTAAEREELRRQLKRLRDEEKEMLADIDELRQRMEQPENQSRMAEAKQQLEQTRAEVQRAAEALEKEMVPQALTSGTRAQRDLQQLRDDFRKKNSSQFTEEMRQMRSEARELAQKEDEIGKQIEAAADNKRKTLTDSGENKQLAEQLQQQKSAFTNLVENMRGASERAESAEPLLSKQLYDTVRKTSQGSAENSLNMSGELLKRNFVKEAGVFEQRARQEIDELKRGVEKAAESVLGDDTEALRLAKRELDELSRQLEEEIAKADAAAQPGKDGSQPGKDQQAQTGGEQQNQQAQSGQGSGGQTNQAAGAQAGRSSQGQQPGQPANQQAASQNGAQPGQNPGEQQGRSQQAQAGQRGQQQGQPGQNPQGQGSQGQDAQQGSQPNQSAQNAQGQGNTPGQGQQAQAGQPGQPDPSRQSGANQPREGGNQRGGQAGQQSFFNEGGQTGGGDGGGSRGPITGPDFANWSDRLRDVEEMIDQPDLRSEVARVRDRAKAMRAEFKRHSKEPQWGLVKSQISTPLAEVRQRVSEELARRESNEALVPIDRDPVPNKFSELVKRYYEKLGRSD